MGIGFNATFLIQIIHFYIAYVLFYQILFKPALAVIDQERALVDQLNAQIENERALLEERRVTQRQHWLAARNYFKKKSPIERYVKPSRSLNSQEIPDTIPTEALIKDQSRALADMLVTHMENK